MIIIEKHIEEKQSQLSMYTVRRGLRKLDSACIVRFCINVIYSVCLFHVLTQVK